MTHRGGSGRQLDGLMALSAAAVVGLVWSAVPLGVPGEWTWPRFVDGPALAAVLVFAVAAVYLVVADRVAQLTRFAEPALVASAMVFLSAVLFVAEPAGLLAGGSREPWVVNVPSVSGYFEEALNDPRSTGEWLAGYEAEVNGGDFLHQGTHPPGLILLNRAVLAAVAACPPLQAVSQWLRGEAWDDSFGALATTALRRPADGPSLAVIAAASWWWAKLTQLAAAAVVWPLALMVSAVGDRANGVRVAALWPLVPAATVFLPKSDCLYAVFGLAVAGLWCHAIGGPRVRWFAAALAGLVASASLWLSLASGPLYAGVAAGSAVWAVRRGCVRHVAKAAAVGAVGVAVPVVAGLVAGVNLPNVWAANLRNHAAFYDNFPRSYLSWLAVNPLEAAVAAGLPIVVAAVVLSRRSEALGCPQRSVAGGVLIAWALLWLSGKNMGEAARLWVLFLPWPIVWLGLSGAMDRRRWWSIAIAAAAAFAAVVARIDGFNLAAAGG